MRLVASIHILLGWIDSFGKHVQRSSAIIITIDSYGRTEQDHALVVVPARKSFPRRCLVAIVISGAVAGGTGGSLRLEQKRTAMAAEAEALG